MKTLALVMGSLVACGAVGATPAATTQAIERGKFLVDYGGCNDCHTPGWDQNHGHASERVLLTGMGFDFQGPWGTTYPANLRLLMQKLSVQQWIALARSMKARPAMPFWIFRYLSDADLRDMYAYIHALGPAGNPAHAYVPPGRTAPKPYLKLVAPVAPPTPVARR